MSGAETLWTSLSPRDRRPSPSEQQLIQPSAAIVDSAYRLDPDTAVAELPDAEQGGGIGRRAQPFAFGCRTKLRGDDELGLAANRPMIPRVLRCRAFLFVSSSELFIGNYFGVLSGRGPDGPGTVDGGAGRGGTGHA